jgi:hypothetical protein
MRFFSPIVLLMAAGAANAQDFAARLKQVEANNVVIQLARETKPKVEPPAKWDYDAALSTAVREGKPLAVFVGEPVREVADAITVRDDRFAMSFWRDVNGQHYRMREVSRPAFPFLSRLLRRGEVQRPIADDRADPQLAGLLEGMEPYTTATMTQHTGRRISGVIWPTPRTTLENKWNVPGHLDGIQGWSSRLYKTRGVKPSVFLVAQDPNDSVSAITWGRAYPDVQFVDVLRNADGKVFEVRVAEKERGRWERFVAFSDKNAQPHGYIRPTSKQCAECHNQAGASAYDAGAIPGADTVLSDPFPNLEAGQSVQGGNRTRL